MISEPYGTTTFCDDIRFERSGKLTLVGCYFTEMKFAGPPPGMLPTFAALINVRVPADLEFKKFEVRIFVKRGDEIDEIFSGHLDKGEEDTQNSKEQVIGLATIPVQWTALEIKGDSTVKVRGYIDEVKEVLLGSLDIKFPEKSGES